MNSSTLPSFEDLTPEEQNFVRAYRALPRFRKAFVRRLIARRAQGQPCQRGKAARSC